MEQMSELCILHCKICPSANHDACNSKAGSGNILSRFVSMRSIKEDFVGSSAVEYPSNEV